MLPTSDPGTHLMLQRLSRRTLLRRGLGAGLSLPAAAALLAACGGDDSSSSGNVQGELVLLNYENWLGKGTPRAFAEAFPGASLKQIPLSSISGGSIVNVLKTANGRYDAALGDTSVVGQGEPAGIVEELDWSLIPNIEKIGQRFRDAYPLGVPTDYGKTGIGYRADLVDEEIAGWADVWSLAEKYSGKIVFSDLDRDSIGAALKYKGHSANTKSEEELEEAKQALIEIKPHLRALESYNIGANLVKGSAAIVMDWDYDVALAQAQNDNIRWVEPEEGLTAYLEGFFAIKGSERLELVHAFLNFFLEPEQYADFVNTTGTAYTMSEATPLVKPEISGNKALVVDPATLENVEFQNYLGDATAMYAKAWEEFKSA